jgi:hypothetical protein
MIEIKDPIKSVENIVKEVHDNTSKYTQPVLAKYPLLFAFLVVFSVSMIMKGFGDVINQINIFQQKPWLLFVLGIFLLTLTGSLYKWLDKSSK